MQVVIYRKEGALRSEHEMLPAGTVKLQRYR